LHQVGVPVWVAAVPGKSSPLNHAMAELARAAGVRTVAPDGPWPSAGLLVDALLGTGARGAPRAAIASLVERMTDLRIPLVAIDGPTGLDLLNGVTYLPTRSDLCITFGGVRRGHLLARDDLGSVLVMEIGHPRPDPDWPTLVVDRMIIEGLPAFHAKSHKGDRGRVVVIGGNAGMTGAIRIACRAAFAAGAGLVHAVAPKDTIAALVVAEPDVQTLAHEISLPLSEDLSNLLNRADAVIIGPGLGRAAGTADFVLAVLNMSKRAVLDADGLTVLRDRVDELKSCGEGRPLVLTPHPGEFRTLFPVRAESAESDPWAAAAGAASDSRATVLLKGVPTVIAREGRSALTVASGNPGLGTGGSGDLLSGLIGAALAQGLEPEHAAAVGAHALGRAAEFAARRTSARTLRPMDVIMALPDLWRTWEVMRVSPPPVAPPLILELEAPQAW
ncbi:MAG: NAD(P)H-hydrate dehydratase, partial [Gemmatimonadota bacterium]